METKFEDSNIALLGSDLEKEIRQQRSQLEPEWQKIKKEPGLLIWRIEKFNVVPWPKEEYGNFFSGDTYIVLKIKKKPGSDALEYTAHMWVGSKTTQDEAGTGAYKIVELDDFFKGDPTLVYEPQGGESEAFKSYFTNLLIMEGGIESGFKKVPKNEYKPRLLHVSGKGKNVASREVPLKMDSLNSEDCFILDCGLNIYVWRGKGSSGYEKFFAKQSAAKIESDRNGAPKIFDVEEGAEPEEFKKVLGYIPKKAILLKRLIDPSKILGKFKHMMKLSDESGNLTMTEVNYDKSNLKSEDAFLIDRGDIIYIWLGNGSSKDERKFALVYAQKYVKQFQRPLTVPIQTVHEGSYQAEIDKCFA